MKIVDSYVDDAGKAHATPEDCAASNLSARINAADNTSSTRWTHSDALVLVKNADVVEAVLRDYKRTVTKTDKVAEKSPSE